MVRSRPKQWLISGHWHLENRKTLVELVISLNSAWFYISEWKSPGALKTDLNYAKTKSGAWTRWARQALYLHTAALLLVSYHKPCTSLSRGKPNSCKRLSKCLTFQSGRDRFRLAKTVGGNWADNSKGSRSPRDRKSTFAAQRTSPQEPSAPLSTSPRYLLDAAQSTLRALGVWDYSAPSPHSSAPAFRWRDCNSNLRFLYNIQVVSVNSEHSPSTGRKKQAISRTYYSLALSHAPTFLFMPGFFQSAAQQTDATGAVAPACHGTQPQGRHKPSVFVPEKAFRWLCKSDVGIQSISEEESFQPPLLVPILDSDW